MATGRLASIRPHWGRWTIVNKRVNPTWYNPVKDTWAKTEPDFIPHRGRPPLRGQGPDLDAPGIQNPAPPADSSINLHVACLDRPVPGEEIGTPVIVVW